jgi:hypothetical protein
MDTRGVYYDKLLNQFSVMQQSCQALKYRCFNLNCTDWSAVNGKATQLCSNMKRITEILNGGRCNCRLSLFTCSQYYGNIITLCWGTFCGTVLIRSPFYFLFAHCDYFYDTSVNSLMSWDIKYQCYWSLKSINVSYIVNVCAEWLSCPVESILVSRHLGVVVHSETKQKCAVHCSTLLR